LDLCPALKAGASPRIGDQGNHELPIGQTPGRSPQLAFQPSAELSMVQMCVQNLLIIKLLSIATVSRFELCFVTVLPRSRLLDIAGSEKVI
jgi:hypothetical protein